MAAGIVCPHCGLVNHPQRRTCHQCHGDLTAAPIAVSTTPLSLDNRRTLLDQEIIAQAGRGWRLTTRTDTSAQLIKEKQINGCLAIILLCLGIIPGLIYMAATRAPDSLYVDIDEFGRIRRVMHS